uniref:Uncharacterized protein n=1 Tax=Plectus sambesii TaxID=2011161 RepID=A0A914VBQ9_9BILA
MNEVRATSGYKWIVVIVFACSLFTFWLGTISSSMLDVHVDYIRRQLGDIRERMFNNTFIKDHVDRFSELLLLSPSNATDQPKDADKKAGAAGYAVLASDHHFEYLFPLPMVVLSWRRLGIDALVILIGTKEQFESDKHLNYVLSSLRELKTRIFFLNSSLAESFTLAQVSRLYAAALEGLNLPDSTVLITADADMFSFKLSEHMPDLRAGKKIFLYNSQCCGQMRMPADSENYPHIPMNTIAMPVVLWREVMGISPNMMTSGNGDLVATRLYAEFGKALVTGPGGKGSEKWSMDQNLISALLHRWIKKNPANQQLVAEKPSLDQRYDRAGWNYDFSKEPLAGKGDAHFLHPMFGDNWPRMVGLLRLMFTSKELEWCINYHTAFMKL